MRSSRKNKMKYPDEMTCDQMGCCRTFEIFQDLKKAVSYAKETQEQIYTQVDEDVVYSKVIHYVNRTEMYAVVK